MGWSMLATAPLSSPHLLFSTSGRDRTQWPIALIGNRSKIRCWMDLYVHNKATYLTKFMESQAIAGEEIIIRHTASVSGTSALTIVHNTLCYLSDHFSDTWDSIWGRRKCYLYTCTGFKHWYLLSVPESSSAEVSENMAPSEWANSSPELLLTCRRFSKSLLLPTIHVTE